MDEKQYLKMVEGFNMLFQEQKLQTKALQDIADATGFIKVFLIFSLVMGFLIGFFSMIMA